MLSGVHLKVYDYVWPGFAAKDVSAPHGWVGFDIDLLTEMGSRLGFTFEVHEMVPLDANETWDAMLLRLSPHADLVLSYWGRDDAKLDKVVMLQGHIDFSPVLAVRSSAPTAVSLAEKVLQFARPFDWACWLALVLIILASGVVDYLLERQNGGTIGDSIYEYFAGTLWGGFQEPRSKLSAVYQITLGFVLLLVISTYTANLAAFLTVKSIPAAGIGSVDELVARREPACTRVADPNQAMYESILHNRLQYEHHDFYDLAGLLNDDECTAVILPRINFDTWLIDGANCELSIAGPSLMFSSAGWVTNPNSSRCVQRPVEKVLQQLSSEGFLDETLFNAAEDEEDLGVMYFSDFVGILILWGGFTVGVISIRIAQVAAKRRAEALKLREHDNVDEGQRERAAVLMQANIRRKQVQSRRNNGMQFLDKTFGTQSKEVPGFNSQAAMLRHLVSDVHGIKLMVLESLKQTTEATRLTTRAPSASASKRGNPIKGGDPNGDAVPAPAGLLASALFGQEPTRLEA